MKNRNRDPYWITVRFEKSCRCGRVVRKGEQGFYYAATRTLLGKECGCGETASRDFEAARFDEAQYNA